MTHLILFWQFPNAENKMVGSLSSRNSLVTTRPGQMEWRRALPSRRTDIVGKNRVFAQQWVRITLTEVKKIIMNACQTCLFNMLWWNSGINSFLENKFINWVRSNTYRYTKISLKRVMSFWHLYERRCIHCNRTFLSPLLLCFPIF